MIMNHVWLVRSIVLEDLYLTVDMCNSTFVLKWLERKIKINDTLQLLLGRHCLFDIKQILYDYRNGPKYSASFRAITMY